MSANVSTEAHSQQHNNNVSEKSLIESARNLLDHSVITDNNITSPGLLNRVKTKCRKALLDFNDFKQISAYLVVNLTNDIYYWSVLVYPTNSTIQSSVNKCVHNITINFGELTIKLMSHRPDQDTNGCYYEDYDEFDRMNEYEIY